MKDNYDFSKGFRRPELTESLRKNGYRVTVTRGEGDEKRIVEQYVVSPEEVQAHDLLRKSRRVQS